MVKMESASVTIKAVGATLTYKLCPQCGKIVEPNWIYCPYCGHFLGM